MRVLVLTHSYAGHGAGTCLMAVLDHWVRNLGWKIDALSNQKANELEDLIAIGVTPVSNAITTQYDFVLVNTAINIHAYAQVFGHLPTVWWIHEGTTVISNSNYSVAQWRSYFENSALTIFQSRMQIDRVFASFLARVPNHRLAVIPNGIRPVVWNYGTENRTRSSNPVLISSGVLSPLKRPQDLAEIIATIPVANTQALFIGSTDHVNMVDSPAIHNALLANSQSCAGITLTGQLAYPQALATMAKGNVFVSCSQDETQGMAALEAAALGLTVILTDLPCYEGIWKHGQNALIYPVGDRQLLRWLITAVLAEPALAQRLAFNAQATARRFTWDGFISAFDTAVMDAIKGSNLR